LSVENRSTSWFREIKKIKIRHGRDEERTGWVTQSKKELRGGNHQIAGIHAGTRVLLEGAKTGRERGFLDKNLELLRREPRR